jgi:hypothetical protein
MQTEVQCTSQVAKSSYVTFVSSLKGICVRKGGADQTTLLARQRTERGTERGRDELLFQIAETVVLFTDSLTLLYRYTS